MSTFPTSANDSESIKSIKPSTSPPSLFEITFDRSQNPLLINEDFSSNNEQSESNSNHHLDPNNNHTKSTKSSLSSSSPFFDHSSDSSNEKNPSNKELTESDDGIIFLHDEKRSSSSSPIPTQTKSLIEKRKSVTNDKDITPTYFYFVMELCQPESLRDRLIQRMIDRHQAWLIFDQIVSGIEYIHSQKLVRISKYTCIYFEYVFELLDTSRFKTIEYTLFIRRYS